MTDGEAPVRDRVEAIYRAESRRVLATLIRLLGDFDAAEEALHEAFVAALERWPVEGEPRNPRAWLVSAGRFRAIDMRRRRQRHEEKVARLSADEPLVVPPAEVPDDEPLADDVLRLVFTCCHPALAPEAQVALTLRTICGLTTEEIARAWLVPAPTLAQRIVRAKAKIRDARIPYAVPGREDLPERLDAVLQVIYLVFNEGYSATAGEVMVRADLAAEAIRLARLVLGLLDHPEVRGLLALMLLHDARRDARTTAEGDLVLLEDQDRARWSRAQVDEGIAEVQRALAVRPAGPYAVQAAIAALHAEAPTASGTDWPQVAALYDVLLGLLPGPVVELNRAVARAMAHGPAEGLALVDALLARGELGDYVHSHAARADLLRRLGRMEEAREAYERALLLSRLEPERRFLQRRIAALAS